uniref:Uncharacterized protein n=1 Tax=Leviviridae sp. TaxID=2027243 RepID=A0A514D1S3_9VIRU|nr:MAG: hypothetical protein H2Bulk35297_000001 [Leviviridae sp.]
MQQTIRNAPEYPLNSDGITYWQAFHWNEVEGHFTNTGEVSPTVMFQDRFARKVVYDYPAWESVFAQDCIMDKIGVSYYGQDPLVTMWQNRGGDQPWAPLATTLGSFCYVPVCYILNNCLDSNLNKLDFTHLGETSMEHYARLQSGKTLFPSIRIKDDPFKTNFSLWFLLVDLKELPKLYEQLVSLNGQMRGFRRFASAFGSHRAFKSVANAYLVNQFAIKAFIQDLKDFIELVIEVATTVKKKQGMDLANAFRTRVTREDAPGTEVSFRATFREFGCDATVDFRMKEEPLRTYGVMKYYFVQPELAGFLNRIAQLVDRLGLLDPAALWDVLPWTFVMDWFFHVGEWLSRNLKPRLFPSDLVIADYCESSGRTIRWEASLTAHMPAHFHEPAMPLFERLPIARGVSLKYGRKRMFPVLPSIDLSTVIDPTINVFSVKRVLIGSALVGQRSHIGGTGKSSPLIRYRGHEYHDYRGDM